MVTDPQLEGLAAQCLNLAKRDMDRGRFNFLLATWHGNEGLHRMRKIEATIVQMLGEDWLNNGAKKDAAMGVIRMAAKLAPPDAIVFVTAANMFRPTAKFHALPIEEQQRRIELGHDEHHRMAREGLYRLIDCLIAMAQTPERVCHRIQPVPERGHMPDAPETHFFDANDFSGRMKFYGDDDNTESLFRRIREKA
jgi:hypothetical protein